MQGHPLKSRGLDDDHSARITDLSLFVRTSSEDIAPWDRERIVDALLRETDLDIDTAIEISREIEDFIVSSGIKQITTPLIRELVDARLLERGLEKAYEDHRRLGVPVYDVEDIIFHAGKDDANIPHSPEATNLLLAELIKREYALDKVFSSDVRDAHIKGDIHIHGLGFVDRPYSTFQSLEPLKKGGLRLMHPPVDARPARHADVLLSHMIRFSTLLQGHYGASIGWHGVNISFAPYIRGMSYKDIRQLMQRMVFEFSQLAGARGGQPIFSTIHIYMEMPEWVKRLPATGRGGVEAGTYGEFEMESREMVKALLEVYGEGDGMGRPIAFPQPVFHISKDSFSDHPLMELLIHTAQEKGSPHIFFERTGHTLPFPQCEGGGSPSLSDAFSTIQNVSINLPRIGYLVKDGADLSSSLKEAVGKAVKAHIEKKGFIQRLLSIGGNGPLGFLVRRNEGRIFDMDRGVYLIGLVGLYELSSLLSKDEASGKPMETSLKILRLLRGIVKDMAGRYGINLSITQTPGESTPHRFARLDLKYFSPLSGRVVRGDIGSGEVYYNTSLIPVSESLSPLERAKQEGIFHKLIDGEVFTSLFVEGCFQGEGVDLLKRIYLETDNREIAISPEFTTCLACGMTARGIKGRCESCGSEDLDHMARVTTYYSRVSNWNRGKRGELAERFRWRGD